MSNGQWDIQRATSTFGEKPVIFEFVVRRLRWLACVPLCPQWFDAMLLAWTGLFSRDRLKAMEAVVDHALQWPHVEPGWHRYGGMGFRRAGSEFAHLHGNGLLDVHLTVRDAAVAVAAGWARPHHVFGPSAWVSFWIRDAKDVPAAVRLLQLATH